MFDKVMVALELTATNLYQTSSSGVPPQEAFAEMPELVAFNTVPAVVLEQVFE
jgi:hypothetical protein